MYSSHSSSLNDTITFHPTTNGSYTLMAVTFVSLIVSVICLIYITLKLTLNKFIKIILSNIASQNIICSMLMIFANVTMKIFDSKSLVSCLILTQPLLVSNLSTWTMITVLSMLRYLMAWKASKTKILKGNYVIIVIIIGAMLPYLNMIFNLFVNEFKGNTLISVWICQAIERPNQLLLYLMLLYILYVG